MLMAAAGEMVGMMPSELVQLYSKSAMAGV